VTPRTALPVAALAIGMACAGCGETSAAGPGSTTAASSARARDFSTRDTAGNTVRLSDYLGKQVVLLNFSATWCQPCLAEIPHLRKIHESYKAKGLVLWTISMDGPETVAEVPAWAKRNQMPFPVLYDEDSSIASIYNPKKSPPLNILIDKTGNVVWTHEGYNPGDEKELEERVSKALQ
jgi:peroxiredoxin